MIFFVKAALLLVVFMLPLLIPAGSLGYEENKVLFFLSCTSLISFVWFFTRPGVKWNKISLSAGVFILVLFFTSILGIDPKNSLLGMSPYFQGLILYSYLFLFFILVSWSRIKLEHWALSLTCAAALVGILAIKDWVILNFLGQSVSTYAGRVVSTFGQPNFYSGFLLMAMPFEALLIQGNKWRKWAVCSLALSVVGILISGSRTAILMLFGLLVFWYLKSLWGSKKAAILVGAVLIFATAVLIQVSQGLFLEEIQNPFEDQWLIENSPEKRILLWPVLIDLAKEKPIFGYGLENIRSGFSGYFAKIDFNLITNPTYYSLKDVVVDRSHNYILDLVLFSGIIGAFCWILLVFLLVRKARNSFLLTPLLIYLIWIQFQNQSIVHLVYFWLLAGLIDKE